MSGMEQARPINLALQGGGGHGAFAWGVLDRLLETGQLAIDAISATSGGAMNAAVMIDGLERGGPDLARTNLEAFWHGVSDNEAMLASADRYIRVMMRDWIQGGMADVGRFSGLMEVSEALPMAANPLGSILESLVDFERFRRRQKNPLFVSATNVRTGKAKLFSGGDVTAEVIMASGCLPYLFPSVEIDGAAYWDGGYSSNPSLWPFFHGGGTRDVLLVRLYPARRVGIPREPKHILTRINEITFDNALLQELRAIAFVNRLVDEKAFGASDYERHRLHRIDPLPATVDHGDKHWVDNSWDYFVRLRDAGRDAASAWLVENCDDVGVRGTFDPAAEFA
ncbi:MAG: patatin-like phospholipase family protein [Bauldia sp.]|nr:patatin-like phospholipase family protein [Bauldia sp.]